MRSPKKSSRRQPHVRGRASAARLRAHRAHHPARARPHRGRARPRSPTGRRANAARAPRGGHALPRRRGPRAGARRAPPNARWSAKRLKLAEEEIAAAAERERNLAASSRPRGMRPNAPCSASARRAQPPALDPPPRAPTRRSSTPPYLTETLGLSQPAARPPHLAASRLFFFFFFSPTIHSAPRTPSISARLRAHRHTIQRELDRIEVAPGHARRPGDERTPLERLAAAMRCRDDEDLALERVDAAPTPGRPPPHASRPC